VGAGSEQAAVGGGVADKWGNRYEGWWTIWSGVVPVLRGVFGAIRVEPPDAAGEGVEFRLYNRQPSGQDEAHQCKRHRDTFWTVHALDVDNVLAPLGRHLGDGVHGVFVSGTPSILQGMAIKASLPVEEWSTSLNRKETDARDELIKVWGVTEAEVHRRLSCLTVCTVDDVTLKVAVIEALASLVDGDPEEALLWLGDFLLDHLMVPLTARQLWDFLRGKGFPPREGPDPALSEQMRRLTDRYVNGVERTRPANLSIVVRDEVDTVLAALTSSDGPRVVAVTGKPGRGKSTVIAAVCTRLTDLGVVVGPLRLDIADDAWTAESLGAQADIGFGGSPARILARAAAGERAVLVVDQLDALSVLAGRGETVVDGVQEMLEQARAIESLRVLVACRNHDLTYDRRLRQLLRNDGAFDGADPLTDDLVEVPVGNLTVEQVHEALRRIGFAPDAAPARLLPLLTNTFNLGLLASIVQDAQLRCDPLAVDLAAIHAQQDLLAAYHRGRSRRLRQTLGRDGYAAAVFRIARMLSEAGRLSTPRTAVVDTPDTIDALIHEGVLAGDAGRLRFFHEAYFDYVFALQHVQANRTAADLVRGDPQDLLRRGQVRAVLGLERQLGGPQYLTDLQAVLDPRLVRSHLRAATLTWLKDQTTALDDELRIVLQIAANGKDPMRWQAVRALSSQPFASELGKQGLLTAAADVLGGRPSRHDDKLTGLLRRFDETSCVYLLFEGARQLPEAAAAASLPLASDPHIATRLVRALLRTVFLAGPTAGPATAKLFCTIVDTLTDHALASSAGQADETTISTTSPDVDNAAMINNAVGALYDVDGKHALSTLVKQAPAHAADAIRAWLAAAERLADVDRGRNPFDHLLHRQGTGLRIFETCAANAPVEFMQAVLPLMLAQYESAAMRRQRWRPAWASEGADTGLRYDMIQGVGSPYRSLGGEVYDALCTALRLSASQHPQVAAPFIKRLTTTDLLTGHQLAAAAFGACASALLDDAIAWAADPRVRGLPTGFTVGWAWGEVLAHVAATGTDEQCRKATRLAIDGYEDLDLDIIDSANEKSLSTQLDDEARSEAQAAAEEQLIALSVITRRLGDLAPPHLRHRQVTLEQKLGPAPDHAITDPADLAAHSPVPDRAAQGFTNDEWLNTIRTYSEDPTDRLGAAFTGGAADIAVQLETATKSDPGRFAQLVAPIGPDANVAYVTAILRGLTSTAQALSDADARAALDATETVFSWPQPIFRPQVCSLIAALTDRDLPETIVAMVGRIATKAEQPAEASIGQDDDGLVTAGLTSDRGQAIHTLAYLLAPAATRPHRVRLLLPVLYALLDDPHEHVRVLLPPAIVRTYLADRDAAVDLAEQWLQRTSDAALCAPELDRLAWQLFLSRPQAGSRLVQQMIQSQIAEARTRGGALAALTSLRRGVIPGEEAITGSLLHDALQDTSARKGVAIVLAQLVDELPDGAMVGSDAGSVQADRRLLVHLLNDDDQAVRQAAINFALSLTHPLSRHASLLAATTTSRAFTEHPGSMLHALARAAGDLPAEALDICAAWLSRHSPSAGNIQTAAAGDAYYVTEIVLAAHARAAVGSPERQRCLGLIDRLIEAGAADADEKADNLDNS
jgi:hypothetical protein